MYLPRGFEMPLVRMAARAVATVRKGGAWSLPCGRVTYEAVAAAWKGGELGPAPFSRARAQPCRATGPLCWLWSRAGGGAKGVSESDSAGPGPGAEEWSEELAIHWWSG